MRVLLVDADSKNRFPNLALMKYSSYYKQKGYKIDLIRGIPSTKPLFVYGLALISCIFYQNKEKVIDYAQQLSFPYQLGGSGIGLNNLLPYCIEHIMPDYDLYGVDYSLGFTSRGCIRRCSFCIVHEKEGHIKDNAPISEFLDPTHKKLILLDNNFQASPEWKENIQFIIDNKLKVNFNQGLDIRLMNKEFAQALAEVKTYNRTFKTRGVHIAFDHPSIQKSFIKGVTILLDAGIPSKHIMSYVLCGFNTSHKEDIERINTIIKLGLIPFIMPYNKSSDKWIRHYARYINRKYYQFIPFGAYNGGVLIE